MCEEGQAVVPDLDRTKALFAKVLKERNIESVRDQVYIETVGDFAPLIFARVMSDGDDENVKPSDIILGLLQALATCAALVVHCTEDKDGLRDDLIELFELSFAARVRGVARDDVAEPSDPSIDPDAVLPEEGNPSA